MRKLKITFMMLSTMILFSVTKISAQEETTKEEKASPFSVGADVVSNYIWRGSKLSPNPSFQPTVKYTKGGFSAGIWGSFDFASGYSEADPFILYTAPFGLSVGVNDYYLSNLDLFNVSDTLGSHAFELTAGYTVKGFSVSGNYIVNEAPGVGSKGGDAYVQLGYAFKNFNIFAGGGDGWYTSDSNWKICNIGIGATKEIKVTDSFKIPVFGQIIVNPDKKNLFLVIGFTL
jgi:hypothetical protein